MTQTRLEQIAQRILEHTTPEEDKDFLNSDSKGKRLWLKNKLASLEGTT